MKKSSPRSTQLPTSRHLLSPSQPLVVTSVTHIHTSNNRLWSPLAYGLGGKNTSLWPLCMYFFVVVTIKAKLLPWSSGCSWFHGIGVYSSYFACKQVGDTEKRPKREMHSACSKKTAARPSSSVPSSKSPARLLLCDLSTKLACPSCTETMLVPAAWKKRPTDYLWPG